MNCNTTHYRANSSSVPGDPKVPGAPFGLTIADADESGKAWNKAAAAAPSSDSGLPLAGLRVLDFSWVIAGPTTTRYLAAMGADVIKVEAPGAGDPGRASELHTVLGQGKRSIVLDLKSPQAVDIARALATRCDVLIENFATGVMDRLGLGADDLRRLNPGLIYVSASGLGRTGPEANAVAYGTLLQSYAGFAGLNRHPDRPPRIGMAWLDPMCGLLLGFITAAAIWHQRRHGGAARVDFSMIEAMLWTMAEPLLETQLGSLPTPRGNDSDLHVPHGVFRCNGDDSWIALAARSDEEWRQLCTLVSGLSGMTGFELSQRKSRQSTISQALADWSRRHRAHDAVSALVEAGVAAAEIAGSLDLLKCEHLRQRGFWDPFSSGALPGLPWHASFGRRTGAAPGLGEHTEAVLEDVLGRSADEIAALRQAGVFG